MLIKEYLPIVLLLLLQFVRLKCMAEALISLQAQFYQKII